LMELIDGKLEVFKTNFKEGCWKYEICSLKDNGYGSSLIILMAHGLINGWPNVLHIAHFVIL